MAQYNCLSLIHKFLDQLLRSWRTRAFDPGSQLFGVLTFFSCFSDEDCGSLLIPTALESDIMLDYKNQRLEVDPNLT